MRNKTIALIIAFFGGPFGLHKFYLGANFTGILYFTFSWTALPMILALFDFFGLLFMSENDFNRKFNGSKTTPTIDYSHQQQALPSKSTQEITQTIIDLKKLYDNDIITAEEYESKRRKLLDSI